MFPLAVLSKLQNLRRNRPSDEEKRLELTEHLAELRTRIIRCLWYLVIGGVICYYKFDPIFAFLDRPMRQNLAHIPGSAYRFNHFTEPFMVVLQISAVSGFILTAPLIIAEAWGFIGPALTRDEKRPLRFIAPLSIVLFAAGVTLAYWVSQFAIGWFMSYLPLFHGAVLLQDPKAYVVFMLKMMAVFGVVFQLPVVLMFLAWIGILKSAVMKRTWRTAIVGIMVVGLIVTPANDIFSMSMMIIPVIFLYLGSIWLVQIIERKRASR